MSISATAPVTNRHSQDVLAPTAKAAPESRAESNGSLKPFAEDEPSFWDLVDVINPLQHIPVVSTIYQHLTGDTMGYAAKVAGDVLFGGVIGLAFSAADIAVQAETGKNVGDHVWDTVFSNDEEGTSAVADSTPPSEPPNTIAVPTETETPTPPPAAPTTKTPEAVVVPNTGFAPLFSLSPRQVPIVTPPTPTASPENSVKPLASRSGNDQFRPLINSNKPRFMAPPPQRQIVAPTSPPPGTNALLGAQNLAHIKPEASPSTTAVNGAMPPASGPWFAPAMLKALDKYEQSRRLAPEVVH